jgi:phosphatidylinositol alpha-1,6-mannosyltransferase
MSQSVAIFSSEFPPYPGGIGTYSWELARAALRLGMEPVAFVPKIPHNKQIDTDFEVNYCLPSYYRYAYLPKVSVMAALALARRRFDYVLAADLNHVFALAAIRTRSRKIAAVHGTDAKSKIVRYLNRFTPFRPYCAFDVITANSQFTKDLLLYFSPSVAEEKVVVAPLAVSEYWSASLDEKESQGLVARFNFSPDQFILLSVGRIERRKGIGQAVAAVSRLPAEIRARIVYLIVGRTIDSNYEMTLAKAALEADADIRLIGTVSRDELRALYHRADVLLHTATHDRYRAEGFGLAILEAATCGLPAIVTNVDAIPEVVVDRVTGFILQDRDVDAITTKIQTMFTDANLVREMSAACRLHSLSFSWDRCARLTFGLV